VVSFIPLLLYAMGLEPLVPIGQEGWEGPRAGLDVVVIRKNPITASAGN